MSRLAHYRKALTALVGATLAIMGHHWGAGGIVFDLTTLATAAGVYAVPNAGGRL